MFLVYLFCAMCSGCSAGVIDRLFSTGVGNVLCGKDRMASKVKFFGRIDFI